MMRTLDLRDLQPTRAELGELVPRASVDVSLATSTAHDLINGVRMNGELALLEQAERLDGIRPARVRVHADEISDAVRVLEVIAMIMIGASAGLILR